MTALQLFRSGLDTLQIAKELGIRESTASHMVWVERSKVLGLPALTPASYRADKHARKHAI